MPTLKRINNFTLPMGILGAALSTDGNRLAAACMDGVYLVDLNGKTSEKVDQHESYVSSAAFVDDNNTIISAGYDGNVHWYDIEGRARIRHLDLHKFWSWDMAVSPDKKLLASVTGQYLAGGYKYEPAPEREPSVRIVNVETGEIVHSLPHVPSVQAVAFSPDSKFVAAGNLMGEVRIWNVTNGDQVANWTTDAFTSWGIIKSHSYLGGIFSISFTPDGSELLLTGMGPMRDPMAGNGRQLWQKWAWNKPNKEPIKVDETHYAETGSGLMETIAVQPSGKNFVMGGRLRDGNMSLGMFDLVKGHRTAQLKTGYRVTEALFNPDGSKLILVGASKQKTKANKLPNFGRVEVYKITN